METALLVVIAAAIAGLLAWVLARRGAADNAPLAEAVAKLHEDQIAMAERVRALAEQTTAVRGEVAKGLSEQTERTSQTLTTLAERLAVIDAAQRNIAELSGQMVGLQNILSNKQARGAFGEVQLHDLVSEVMPQATYEFQCTLSNGGRADCLLRLPNPPGSIVIDSKFPLESFRALRGAADEATRIAAARAFSADVLKHVKDISEKYIVPGETAESALMFLPSEAVYAELHTNFVEIVERSHRARVWIVSPTTLWATLNTLRAVLKDVQMREQAGLIQNEVRRIVEDVARLDERVGNLQRHFGQATKDLQDIRTSTDKIVRGAEKIENVELGEVAAAPVPPKISAVR
jgi:DNA recombination protein RmuC